MHGKPTVADKIALYDSHAPFTNKAYDGETEKGIIFRRTKHRDQLQSRRPLDYCHSEMQKLGFGLFLFVVVISLLGYATTKKERRYYEFKLFMLLRPTLNSQDQVGTFNNFQMIL